MSTLLARRCDPNLARDVLRAWLEPLTLRQRRAHFGRHKATSNEPSMTITVSDNQTIGYTGWELHALAGDMIRKGAG